MNDPRRLRDMRDMVVNGAWKQLLVEIEAMLSGEKERLCRIVAEEGMEAIKCQGGVVVGIEKVLKHLQVQEEKARSATRA